MIDAATQKPLSVSTEYPPRPYIRVSVTQLPVLRSVLADRRIPFSVSEHAISINGGPEMTEINLSRGVDAGTVQAVLDSTP